MEPLGARPQTVEGNSLPRWSKLDVVGSEVSGRTYPNAHTTTPFPIREDLNEKITLWDGDIAQLRVTSIVNPTNESLSDKNAVSERIFEVAGPELRDECKQQIRTCRTGEAKCSNAFSLPARYVIHTVGPRYNAKYRTAAESALYNCYRNVLQIVREREMYTVGLSVVNSVKRGYPPEEGAHIAIRTVRRFLEHYSDQVELIVFAVQTDHRIYSDLLPLYFPRNQKEAEFACVALPSDVGNEFGEPVIEERQIRIADNPLSFLGPSASSDMTDDPDQSESVVAHIDGHHGDDDDDEENDAGEFMRDVGKHQFAMMEDNHDVVRREQIQSRSQRSSVEQEQAKKYQHYLKKARSEDFRDIASLQCFYKAGVDYMGRTVVVFIGRLFPASTVPAQKAMAYFVHLMDSVANKDFVVVYFHTESIVQDQLSTDFFKQLYLMLDERYQKNLRSLYIVHPAFWFKFNIWWFMTFTASAIKDRLTYITGIQFLFDTINPDQLDIPQFIWDYDKQINGTSYHIPTGRPDGGGL
ncbi:protein GDAP2 homolog [Dysidea avara]|uniref:protein GDAP2 homolog n=1 Tax=Dysidea avara TaxID=196820 RepID=UPI00331674BC